MGLQTPANGAAGNSVGVGVGVGGSAGGSISGSNSADRSSSGNGSGVSSGDDGSSSGMITDPPIVTSINAPFSMQRGLEHILGRLPARCAFTHLLPLTHSPQSNT